MTFAYELDLNPRKKKFKKNKGRFEKKYSQICFFNTENNAQTFKDRFV